MLVDDEFRCVITDFGQSEMKSEAFRLSGTPPPRMSLFLDCSFSKFNLSNYVDGALRWQAPEIMMGLSELTPEVDVYAFAMTCIEILSMGRVPWSLVGDDSVRHFVLSKWCCCYWRAMCSSFYARGKLAPTHPDHAVHQTG